MSDEVSSAERDQREEQPDAQAPSRRGGGLAILALLLSLIAIGLAGYPYYQRMAQPASPQSNGELDAVRLAQQRQVEALKRLDGDFAELDAGLKQQQTRIEALDARPDIVTPPPASPVPERALKLGEAEFLLQSANDRLVVTRDPRAALATLLAAQSLVGQSDDPSLSDVRTALSSEIASLRDASSVDFDATLQSLQDIERAIPELPVRGARFAPTSSAPPSEPTVDSTWDTAWRKFSSLFEFRRQNASRPPPGPDEASYLRLNLELMVQMAGLALVRSDGAVYQHSLESMARSLDDYFDTSSADVAQMRSEVDQLLTVRINRSLPDISGSLAALRRVDTSAPPEGSAESVAPVQPADSNSNSSESP